jgi:SpoVK/Ycf46/Vps4 family AAA+-type ATPase
VAGYQRPRGYFAGPRAEKPNIRRRGLGGDCQINRRFTGADLENLLNEAALLAAMRGKAYDRHGGHRGIHHEGRGRPEKKSRVISLKEKRLTAYHERDTLS